MLYLIAPFRKKTNENCRFRCWLTVSPPVNIVLLLSCCFALLFAEQLRSTLAAKETRSGLWLPLEEAGATANYPDKLRANRKRNAGAFPLMADIQVHFVESVVIAFHRVSWKGGVLASGASASWTVASLGTPVAHRGVCRHHGCFESAG